mgnify:CR=1 FL=1
MGTYIEVSYKRLYNELANCPEDDVLDALSQRFEAELAEREIFWDEVKDCSPVLQFFRKGKQVGEWDPPNVKGWICA